jgi:universal stress protein E
LKPPHSILAVVDHSKGARALALQATNLARQFGARLELFLCASEQAYVLAHSYERAGVEDARAACVAEARAYLRELKAAVAVDGVDITLDAACESPLYEGIVHKVLRRMPDLVIKRAGTPDGDGGTPDQNDWQLMRTCPVTLMLRRRRAWGRHPRFAAAIDVSDKETDSLAQEVLEMARTLATACPADLDVIYAEADVGARMAPARLAALLKLCEAHRLPGDQIHVLYGQPEPTLPAFAARQHYDLLVLGALGHQPAGAPLLGTLTSRLLDALECDFVLVKPPGYRSPIGGVA